MVAKITNYAIPNQCTTHNPNKRYGPRYLARQEPVKQKTKHHVTSYASNENQWSRTNGEQAFGLFALTNLPQAHDEGNQREYPDEGAGHSPIHASGLLIQ